MRSWKCLAPGPIPRGVLRAHWAALPLLVSALAAFPAAGWMTEAILPPDAAARAYEAGRDAARRGEWTVAVRRLEEALATGHTRPEEHFGTTRNFVDRYDPDYWLGVAYMELGNRPNARMHLLRSKTNGAIARWPEFSDLVSRLALLQQEERRPETATPFPEKTPEAPPPAPERSAVPTPILTPIATPTARPMPIPPNPAPTPLPLTVEAARAVEPTPASRALDPVDLESLLSALARGDFRAFEAGLNRVRLSRPDAIETPLLEAVACANRYLLEGKREPALLSRAKRSLAEFRKRGGARRIERLFLSPALEGVL